MVKNLSAKTGDTGDMGLIPGSGRNVQWEISNEVGSEESND